MNAEVEEVVELKMTRVGVNNNRVVEKKKLWRWQEAIQSPPTFRSLMC